MHQFEELSQLLIDCARDLSSGSGRSAHADLHCVIDNLSAHGTPAVEAFLDAHPRVFLHRNPTHAFWLNQVQLWLSILTRQLLNSGEFTSTADPATAIIDFIEDYNQPAKPFCCPYNTRQPAA